MNYDFKLSKLALSDLDSIWEYTFESWSKTQANRYYKDLFKAIDTICASPEIGRSINEVKKNHRIIDFKSHMIIYKIIDQRILIDRILHKRMDIDTILDE